MSQLRPEIPISNNNLRSKRWPRCCCSSKGLLATVAPMKRVLILAAIGLLVTGCASPNVNPPRARANTGYVDFYADSSGELSWEVARFDERKQSFQSVFSEFEPPPGRALRLAFA